MIELYDASGRCVWRDGIDLRRAGGAELRWDGRDAQGRHLPRGVYQARVAAAGAQTAARIVRVD
jgi:flagellar hook assembly protein FlgD